MHVRMSHGLSRCHARVDANIHPITVILQNGLPNNLSNQSKQITPFITAQFLHPCNVTAWYDQQMARGYWEGIGKYECTPVPLRVVRELTDLQTEWTIGFVSNHCPNNPPLHIGVGSCPGRLTSGG